MAAAQGKRASVAEATAGAPRDANRAIGTELYERAFMIELLRLRDGMKEQFKPILKNHGMTDQNWRILKVVVDFGPIEVTQISRAAVIPPASLSRILPKMEAAKLVVRSVNPDDMRRTMIEATPKGRSMHASIAPLMREAYIKVAKLLDIGLLQDLDRIVAELNRQLQPENH